MSARKYCQMMQMLWRKMRIAAAQYAGYEKSLVARLTLKTGKVALVYI